MATEPSERDAQQRGVPTREELRSATLGGLIDAIRDQIKVSDVAVEQRALSSAYALCVGVLTGADSERVRTLQEEVETYATKMVSRETDGVRALLTEAIRRGHDGLDKRFREEVSALASSDEENVHMADSVSRSELDAKLDSIRHEMRADAAALRSDFAAADANISKTAATMAISVSQLKGEIEKALAESRADAHKMDASIKTWMIATVIGLFLGFGGLFFAMSNAQRTAQSAPAQPQPVVVQVPPSISTIQTPGKAASTP